MAGSGSAFVNVRLGYVQNRRDKPEKWGTCHPVAATAGHCRGRVLHQRGVLPDLPQRAPRCP